MTTLLHEPAHQFKNARNKRSIIYDLNVKSASSIMAQPGSTWGFAAERLPLPRHEILHFLRGLQEEMHRDRLWKHETFAKWVRSSQFNPTDLETLPEMELGEANDCCNRIAPIYVLRDRFIPDGAHIWIGMVLELFLIRLQNYLYTRWFRPYRSDIEYGQFLARIFLPRPSPLPKQPCSQSMVDFLTALHSNTCARVDSAQDRANDLADANPEEQEEKLNWKSEASSFKPASVAIREQEFCILQPLFRAIVIAIRFDVDSSSRDISDMKSTSVLIARTGIEHGLSAPISFDSISADMRTNVLFGEKNEITAFETSLERAVDFLMELEQREIAAFGLRPDPVESTRNLEMGYCEPICRDELLGTAVQLGWTGDLQILKEPSSTWVDTEKYPKWSGPGAKANHRHHFGDFGEAGLERRLLRREVEAKANRELHP